MFSFFFRCGFALACIVLPASGSDSLMDIFFLWMYGCCLWFISLESL